MSFTPAFTAPAIVPLDAAREALLAERLHRLLDGGTPRPDSKYQRRELALHVRSAYEAQQGEVQYRNAAALQTDFLARQKLLKEIYFDELKVQSVEGGTRDKYLRSFIAPVHTDPDTDRDYCQLPAEFVSLGQYQNLPGEGVQDVQALSRYDRRRALFVPLRGTQDGLLRDLFPGGLDGAYSYVWRGERVEFEWDNFMQRPAQRFPQLELLLVIRRRDSEQLPPPALLQDAENYDILVRAQKLALGTGALEDKVIDANPVTT